MAVFNEPTKWQTSLVNSGDANTIPQNTPAGTGEASFEDGFPPITQVPIGAGGQAPDRKDFNGLFKILGDWIFFNQNGGLPTYSADFDYVAGRVVLYNDNIYKCIQANGVSSTVVAPDSDTAYWQRIDNFVRSVNGVTADTQGNVTISSLDGYRLIYWETDYFDIAPSGLYSFDLSNTDFANISKDAINIQMIAKVKTAQNGFKVGDYVYPQFANYVGSTANEEDGSTPYISGNVLSIRFGNGSPFAPSGPNGVLYGLDKANVKVKLMLNTWIKEV